MRALGTTARHLLNSVATLLWLAPKNKLGGLSPSVYTDFGRDKYALANVGPNLLTGNDLQSGLGSWTAVSGTVTASGGVMRVAGDGSGGRAQYTMTGLTVGKLYVLTFNFRGFNGTNIVYAVSPNASSTTANADMVGSSSSTGAKQLLFVATGTTRNVLVAIGNTAVGNWADVSDFVVREIVSTLGPNLVRNGDFATDLTGWTDASTAPATVVWSGGSALTSTDGVAAARLRQTIATIPGRTYVFSHAGGAACAVGTAAGGQELLAFKQAASRTFIATGTATYVSMATSGNALTVDDVSVREVLVGLGPELVTNSEFDSDLSGWSPLSGADITSTWVNGAIQIVRGTGGASGAPTSTAIALNPGRTYVIVAGNVGSATCRVALTGGQVFGDGSSNMDVAAGAVGTKTFTATISSSAILLYPAGTSATTLMNYVSVREVLTNQPLQPVTLNELLSVSSGAKTVVANDNTLKLSPANYPAFDYSSGKRQLLLEGAATNLCSYSNALTTVWNNNGSSNTCVDSGATIGDYKWWEVAEGTGTGNHMWVAQSAAFTSGTTYVFSCLVKYVDCRYVQVTGSAAAFSGGTHATYDLVAGTVTFSSGVSASIERRGSGVYLITFVTTASATVSTLGFVFGMAGDASPANSRLPSYTGTNRKVWIAAPQTEAGTVASSRILTGVSSATRVTDVCAFSPLLNLCITQMAATMAYRANVKSRIQGQHLIGLAGGTALLRSATDATVVAFDGSTTQPFDLASGILQRDIGAAIAWDTSGRSGSVNELSAATRTSGVDRQMPPFFFGRSDGMPSGGSVHELGAFVAWPLKGSNSNLQQQARAYA